MRRRAAAPAAAAVLLAGAVCLSRGWPRGLLTETFLAGLRVWDAFHLAIEPSLELTRPAERADPRPLAEQAAAMEADLDRDFTAADGRLFVIETPPVQLGDVCLWQGVFAAEAALRWSQVPSAAALGRADRAMEGLALLAVHGRPLARSIYPVAVVTERPGLAYFRDRTWQWKEDASVDSEVGWVFGMVMLRELVPALRPRADRLLAGFAGGLRGAGYRLRNSDGSLTRFNRVGGAIINAPPGVLATMTVLQAAARAEPEGPWAAEHARFVAQGQDRWGAYASGPMLWRNKTTNHNIGVLALAAALLVEDDPARKAVYARGLVRMDRLTAKMGNSFWTYLTLWALTRTGMGDPAEDDQVARWMALRSVHLTQARVAMQEWDYPRSKVKRETVNSTRIDIDFGLWPLSGRRTPSQPLAVWQRPPADFVWQRSAYALDDWQGYRREPPQRFSPLDFLAAYRLGRAVGGLDGSE